MPEDPIEYNLKVIDKLDPDSTASMQKDIAKGHESEIQGLLFDMIALGEKTGCGYAHLPQSCTKIQGHHEPTLSAILWNPDIETFPFSAFPSVITPYCLLQGFHLAYWVIYKLYQDQKIPYEKFDSLFVYCLLGIVIGARLGHCLFYEPGYWLSHPVEMLLPVKITDSGHKMDRLSRSCQPWRNHRTNARLMDLFTPCKIEVPDCTRQYSHRHPAGRLFYPFR